MTHATAIMQAKSRRKGARVLVSALLSNSLWPYEVSLRYKLVGRGCCSRWELVAVLLACCKP